MSIEHDSFNLLLQRSSMSVKREQPPFFLVDAEDKLLILKLAKP